MASLFDLPESFDTSRIRGRVSPNFIVEDFEVVLIVYPTGKFKWLVSMKTNINPKYIELLEVKKLHETIDESRRTNDRIFRSFKLKKVLEEPSESSIVSSFDESGDEFFPALMDFIIDEEAGIALHTANEINDSNELRFIELSEQFEEMFLKEEEETLAIGADRICSSIEVSDD